MEANNYNIPAKVELTVKFDKETIAQLIISTVVTAIIVVIVRKFIFNIKP